VWGGGGGCGGGGVGGGGLFGGLGGGGWVAVGAWCGGGVGVWVWGGGVFSKGRALARRRSRHVRFNETKNSFPAKAAALLVSDHDSGQRGRNAFAERDRRGRFFRGEVRQYTWQDVGCHSCPVTPRGITLGSTATAQESTDARSANWQRYHEMLATLESQGCLRRPTIPADCQKQWTSYLLVLEPETIVKTFDTLKRNKVGAVFHMCDAFFRRARASGRATRRSRWTKSLFAAFDKAAELMG